MAMIDFRVRKLMSCDPISTIFPIEGEILIVAKAMSPLLRVPKEGANVRRWAATAFWGCARGTKVHLPCNDCLCSVDPW